MWLKIWTINVTILSYLQTLSSSLKILNVWTPEVVENGTETSAIVDCEYQLDDRDITTFELKWYFRFDPTPIYTWIPPNPPQISPEFSKFVNINSEISQDPLLKYRALNLTNIGTHLSGRYSCKVSSIYDEDVKSKDLIIYAKPESIMLSVGWIEKYLINITCQAKKAYPEPRIEISVDGNDLSFDFDGHGTEILTWMSGSYFISLSRVLKLRLDQNGTSKDRYLDQFKTECVSSDCPFVECQVTLPKTSYSESRCEVIPALPEAFIYNRVEIANTDGAQPCQQFNNFLLIMLISCASFSISNFLFMP